MALHKCIAIRTWEETHKDGSVSEHIATLCGKDLWKGWAVGNPDRVSCPDCGKKHWAKRLAECAVKLHVEKSDEPAALTYTHTRSLYKVMRGAEHIAWIGPVPGWGAGWGAFPHHIRHIDRGRLLEITDVLPVNAGLLGGKFRDFVLFELANRLADPTQAERMRQDGYRDRADYLQAHIEAAAARAERAREDKEQREREAIERGVRARQEAERRADATLQLHELYARADLSNFQREGLIWAMEQLSIPLPALEPTQ